MRHVSSCVFAFAARTLASFCPTLRVVWLKAQFFQTVHERHGMEVTRCMDDGDVLLLGLAVDPSTRRGRLGPEALVHSDGPALFCVVVGTPEGRWHAELTSAARGARLATRLLCVANDVLVSFDVTVDTLVTLGVALMLSWRFVHGAPGHEQTVAMTQAAQAAHPRRQGMQILEHPVLHSMPLLPGACPASLPENWMHMPANSLGRALLEDLTRCTNGESHRIVTQWEGIYGPLADVVVVWPDWAPLARALAHGKCHADVTPRFRCSDTGHSWDAPVMLSARLLRFFPMRPRDGSTFSDTDLAPDSARGHGTRVTRVPIQRVMDGVRFGSVLTSQRHGGVALRAASAILSVEAPGAAVVERVALVTRLLPSRQTLQRARVCLDVGAMLYRRWLRARETRPVYRYIAYDASPQQGVEIFATVERVVTVLGSDMIGAALAVSIIVDERRLPLVTLGHGRFALADKLHAHVRQSWLKYGPRQHTLQRANTAARQCVSDMGTEFGLADVPDVTHACIRSGHRDTTGECLYPCALQVPGCQHLLDTILQDGLDSVLGCPAWEEQAKLVCHWAHPRPRREFLQRRLKGPFSGLSAGLDIACERFADWRWTTLTNVTRDLLRMRDALQHATVGLGSSAGDADTFITAVQSALFWAQCHALHALAKPVADFSSWLRGCVCHEAETMAHAEGHCVWKGCRAPELSNRVRAFAAEVLALSGAHAEHDAAATHGARTRMLAVAQLKFARVDDMPFFVWQVRPLATAAAFLAKFDTSPAPHHRVTLRFGTGELRQDMDAWAAGAAPSLRVRMEAQSYQWCKLDDTWAAASHRDVARLAKRATFASQAWHSASQHLQQNLALWDSLDMDARARFDRMFYRWKAIGQLKPRLALSLTRRKLSAKAVLQFVYRAGAHGLEDWSTHLRHALHAARPADVLPQLSFAA